MLEVMVAMSVLAALTAIVWAAINGMFETRDFVQQRYERYQIMRVALDRMNSELASAYVAGPAHGAEERFEENQAPKDRQEAERKVANAQREPVEYGMRGRNDQIDFTSFAHLRTVQDERASYHAEIGYRVKNVRNDEGDLVKSLVRREDTTIDDDITKGGKVYTLIPNVEDVEFEYWDPGDVDLGTEEEMGRGRWVDSWDTSDKQYHDRLPFRVRITVTLPAQGPRSKEEKFSTQTQIMTHELLNL